MGSFLFEGWDFWQVWIGKLIIGYFQLELIQESWNGVFRVAQLGRTLTYDITLRFGNLEFTMSTYE
jgi:hypothetical protein